ncbi:SGNH hydrolase-type esterase domain-containing protein [Nemania sp. FL0916]|nr:SGNH hydrolase-type esterase domain-containing protein [Nemania sp. FL0916]
MARKRLLAFLLVPIVFIALLFSGSVSEGEWSQTLGNGLKSGVSYVTGDGSSPSTFSSGGVTYVSSNSSNNHLGHGTTKFWKSKAYKRPGFDLPLADGMPLRIMALGASTTRGDSPEKGIDNNGFRRPLRERLTKIGNPVNFVGTQRLGNMTDNDIEAYPGVPTHRIHFHAKKAVPSRKPNLFLINAGSNDCFQHIDIDNFYKRYDALVQYCLKASPRSTVIISTILPTWDKRFNGREDVWRVNPQIRRLAKIYEEQGKPVVLAELQGPDGVQDGNLAEDGMHPGTAGYEMMATKLFEAIVEADAKGFLQTPEPIMGILDDGDAERKDELYFAKLEEHQTVENATMLAEQAEIDRMKAELTAIHAGGEDKEKQKPTDKPTEKTEKSTRHLRRNREHRFPQLQVV